MNTMSFLTFEPDEPSILEKGLIACGEKRQDAAASWFRYALEQSKGVERPQLAAFFLHLLQIPPENDDEWLVRAGEAPTTRIRFSCLKMVVRLNAKHLKAWEEMIVLCKALPNVSLKNAFVREMWNCMRVNTPNTISSEILAILTPEEELELGERRATALRHMQERPAELEGIPLRRFRDWVVTTGGIESLIAPYDIYWREIWSPHWEDHLQEKGGSLGSYQDFLKALTFARAFFPVPPDERTAQAAYTYKQRLLPKRKDWFEDNRIHTALGGLRVRSKSEVIIANLLTMRQISFIYEQRLEAKDGTFRFPDFTLNWNGHTYYWEHLGMLEDVAYLERCDNRLRWYREHGFEDVLIVTTEVGGLDCDTLVATLQERL